MKLLKTMFQQEELTNFYKVAEVINNMISNKQIYNQKEHSIK